MSRPSDNSQEAIDYMRRNEPDAEVEWLIAVLNAALGPAFDGWRDDMSKEGVVIVDGDLDLRKLALAILEAQRKME